MILQHKVRAYGSVKPPLRMRMRYPGDFIVGAGEWRLESVTGGTRVVKNSNVAAHGRLVAWLGEFLPLGKLHSKLLRGVLENLKRETTQRAEMER